MQPPDSLRLVHLLEDALHRHGVPGAIVVGRAEHRDVAVAVGVDPSTGRPVDASMRFQVGSVSKPVTALVVSAAHEARFVDWSADLATLAPNTTSLLRRNGFDAPITLAMLASHSAGLGVHGFLGYGPGEHIPSLAEVITGVGNSDRIEVEAAPGTAYRYSGGGYVVAERALTEATGRTLDDLARELVFGPAGMSDASFTSLPGDAGGAIDGRPMAEERRHHPERAAAGLVLSSTDLARLVGTLTAARRDPTHPLAAAFDRVVQPAVLSDGRPSGAGHGVEFVDDGEGRRWFTHRGRNLGFCAHLLVEESGRYGAAVATNSFPQGSDLAVEAVGLIADELGWPGGSPLAR